MAVIRQIFILCTAVAIESCQSLPHPPPFDHPGIPGPPPYRNIFTDFVQNLANGIFGGFLGNGHGNGIRPGGYNYPPNTRPGYGEYYDNGFNNVGVNIPGQSFGINDHRGPQQGGFNGNGNGYNTGIGQGGNNGVGNNGEVPEQNTPATIIPQKPDINGEKDKGDAPVNNYFIVVPLNPNEIKPKPQGESNSNTNGASMNDVSNNAGGENVNMNGNVNGNAIVDAQVTNSPNNPEQQKEDTNTQLDSDPDLKYNVNTPQEPKVPNQIEGNGNNQEQIKDDSIENEKQSPGFNGETTNEGTLIVDPEVKYNINKPDESKLTSPDDGNMIANRVPRFNDKDIKNGVSLTDPESKHGGADELDKFRNPDAIVFPDEGTQIIIENLPNRFSNAESTNQPSNNAQVTQPTPASNNAVIQNQNQNQQLPANNGNAPYVNGAGNSNDAYTVVSTPTSYGSSGSSNGNAGVSTTGQSNGPYVNAVGNPNGYSVTNVPNNAGNPGLSYVVPSNGNSGQSYVVPSNGNAGTNNPSVVYVLSNGNSGVSTPLPSYVSTNYGTNYPSQSYGYNNMNKPTQVYIPNGNAGGNPNQIYVLANPGDYNLGQYGQSTPRPIYVTIPGAGAQTTNGGYYKPIYVPANNGPISVPVNYNPVVSVPTGPGYQVVGSNPGVMVSYQTPGNVMTSGGNTPPPNVPLLISYKDDERDDDEKKNDGKKKAKQTVEEDRDIDELNHDHYESRQKINEMIEH